MTTIPARIAFLILIFTLLIPLGCSAKVDGVELGQVTGQVTLDDDPLSDVCVHFIPENGRESVGMTDKEGRYEVCYLPKVMGAKVGKHSVAITVFINDDTDIVEKREKSKIKIPAKYNAKTTLSADVKKGRNVCNFELTSD